MDLIAPLYATEADFVEHWGDRPDPANLAGLLRAASALVADAVRLAAYPVLANGAPHPTVAAAFRAATVEQASYWAANGLDPAAGAVGESSAKVVASKSIQGASISYDTGAAAADRAARQQALSTLCPPAWAILRRAGLTSSSVSYGW